MGSLVKWWWCIGFSCAAVACSPGPDALLQDGHAAMDSLNNTSVDTVLVNKGITSLVTFADHYPNDPRVDSALFMLGSLYSVLGRNQSATDTFLKLIGTYPESRFRANSIILAGHIYEEVGDYDKAKGCFERLIHEYPQHDFVLNGSAQALIDHMGQPLEEWLIPFEGNGATMTDSSKSGRSSI